MKFLLLAFSLIMLQSCVVLNEEFYFPSASGGNVEQESCRGQVGADNVLSLDLKGVIAKFSVRKIGESFWFYATLNVPKGTNVIWPDQRVGGNSELDSFDLTIESFAKVVSRGENYKTAEYPVGMVMENSSEETMESYFESISFSKTTFKALEIEGIHLMVNGEKISIPKMRFEKASGLYLHPLNC